MALAVPNAVRPWAYTHHLRQIRASVAALNAADPDVRSDRVRDHGRVRIEGEPGEPLATVYLWLKPDEARELRDALEDLLSREDPNWHAHVPSEGLDREITVALDA